jgi:hypothetical protein
MQLGKIDGFALIVLGLMLFGLQTMVYMTPKQLVTGPHGLSTTKVEHENVSGSGNPWHSVFDGRCSHPRHAPASRRTRGKNRRLSLVGMSLLASFWS